MQPLVLYSAYGAAPNPIKVLLVLHELNLPYRSVLLGFDELHAQPYESVNPNGRLPSLVDPNRDSLTIWESGAILEYLIENYDPEHKLHSADFATKYLEKQYLFFQMSGQGPYFGQAIWFTVYHPEKVESAKQRYYREIDRVTSVLDEVLKDGREYLTGSQVSYADIAFLPWYWVDSKRLAASPELAEWASPDKLRAKYPRYGAWMARLEARPAVQKVREMASNPSLMLPATNIHGEDYKAPN